MSFEEWHAYIAAHLHDPVTVQTLSDEEVWFTSGEPPEVVVRLRRRAITVFEFATVEQQGETMLTPRRVGGLHPSGVDDGRAMSIVQQLIYAARERRRRRFRPCRRCERPQPPENMRRHRVCRECAAESLDVVH